MVVEGRGEASSDLLIGLLLRRLPLREGAGAEVSGSVKTPSVKVPRSARETFAALCNPFSIAEGMDTAEEEYPKLGFWFWLFRRAGLAPVGVDWGWDMW